MSMREALAQYHGKRIKVTGIFDKFGCDGEASGQTVLIQDLHTDGVPLCNHCWVQQAENFVPLDLKRGDAVQFTAAVLSYKKRLPLVQEDGTSYRVDYSLYRPTSVVLLECEEAVEEELPKAAGLFTPCSSVRRKSEVVADVQRLADEVGFDQLQKILDLLKDD